MFLAYVKAIGFVPRLARVTPNFGFGNPLYSLHAGFCRMVGSGHGRSHRFCRTMRDPNPFQQVGVFAVPRSRSGDRVASPFLLKVFKWGATLLYGWRPVNRISICATVSLSPTPLPALTKCLSELYPGGCSCRSICEIREEALVPWTRYRSDHTQKSHTIASIIYAVLVRSWWEISMG
jgi:hypothetical protein